LRAIFSIEQVSSFARNLCRVEVERLSGRDQRFSTLRIVTPVMPNIKVGVLFCPMFR